jgi:hypothetical protein
VVVGAFAGKLMVIISVPGNLTTPLIVINMIKITYLSLLLLLAIFHTDRVVQAQPQPSTSQSVEQPPALPSFLWTGTYIFSEGRGRIRVLTKGFERYGYINQAGKIVIPTKYLANDNFSQGLAAVKFENQKYGFINRRGEIVIPPKFDEAYSFINGLAVVKVGNKMGVIDRLGNFIVKPIHTNTAWEFQESLLAVKRGKLWGFVNTKGKLVIEPQFMLSASGKEEYDDKITNFYTLRFSEGLAAASKDGVAYGYIDKQGKTIVPYQFKYARSFSEGLGLVQTKTGQWGFINKTGKLVISLPTANNLSITEATLLSNFSEGLAGVKIGDKWGFIDRDGKQVIPPQFDNVYPFSEGLAGVSVQEKYGFIDRSGKQVIPPTFDRAFSFKQGLAPVVMGEYGTVNAKVGYIDRQGKLIIVGAFTR